MAARKPVGAQQQHRGKEGALEMEKTKGLKKVWKTYNFKVTRTYILCFKSDLSNPEKQHLVADVTKVLLTACRGASFPFEVHFKGKGSWKLNAGSNEERMEWMEAIQLGSSSSINSHSSSSLTSPLPSSSPRHHSSPSSSTTEVSSTRSASLLNRTPPPNDTSFSGHNSSSLKYDPRTRADPNPYSFDESVPSKDPSNDVDDEEDDAFLKLSLDKHTTDQTTAQAYLVPSEDLSPRDKEQKFHAPPRHSASDGDVMKSGSRPRPNPRPRPRPNPRPPASTEDEDYISMMSSPARRALLTTVSEGELPQYLEVVGESNNDETLDQDNYVIPNTPPPIPVRSTNSFRQERGVVKGVELDGGASYNVVDTISQHFNKEQIGMLIQMLQKVSTDKKQTAEEEEKAWEIKSPSSPSLPVVYGAEDSITLRGNLSRALSYAPRLTEGILVTEDDSDESYEQRPQWAKAVGTNSQTANGQATNGQLDTLTDLQQEALYLSKNVVKDLTLIGQGQFGQVFKGELTRGVESMPVAVKMTKKTISEYLQQSFMKEMSIMSQMMHPNIVRLYGIVKEDVPSPWIVLEYMEHGDLKTFLTANNDRSVQQLVKYMMDIAMGMHYISERGLVHRDLAARNILVGANEICKVADFGLLREIPRDLSTYTSSHSIPCPIRWMPPESISDRQFSPASDVWSFGVLVWEMFNPTKLPFAKYENMAVIAKVNEGLRLPIPRGAPSIVARIMKACWHRDPNKRPSFLLISTLLSTRATL